MWLLRFQPASDYRRWLRVLLRGKDFEIFKGHNRESRPGAPRCKFGIKSLPFRRLFNIVKQGLTDRPVILTHDRETMTTGRTVLLLIAFAALWPGRLAASDEPAGGRRRLPRDIKPVLSKRCYACHGALQQKAGLRLDTAALMKKGGDSGPAIEPRSSDDSLIIDAVTGKDGWRMPPESEGVAAFGRGDRQAQGVDRSGSDRARPTSNPSPTRGGTGRFSLWGTRRFPRPPLSAQSAAWVRNPDRRIPGR